MLGISRALREPMEEQPLPPPPPEAGVFTMACASDASSLRLSCEVTWYQEETDEEGVIVIGAKVQPKKMPKPVAASFRR